MLYVTTRNINDAFTAHRVLHSDHAPDGGFYVPFKLPAFTADDVKSLLQKNFGQIVAEILNAFFSTHLTGWDVDLCIGRSPVKTVVLGQKILVAEMYHNHASDFRFVSDSLYRKLAVDANERPTEWFEIAVRVAVLFGIFGELCRNSADELMLDVSVRADDLPMTSAAWYARAIGLPIGKIIYSCQENSAFWDLLRRGTYNASVHTSASGVERYVHNVFGAEETKVFLNCLTEGRSYAAGEEQVASVRESSFAAAISKSRLDNVIGSLLSTDSYQTDHQTAFCFGGLQDYRASTGESNSALILIEEAKKR